MRGAVTCRFVSSLALLALFSGEAAGEDLQVFQDLEEVTSRIPNLKDKPHKALIDAHGGFFQSEVMIFKDVETGNEVWSLSRELCMDMAHTGRRPAWSGNGRYISFKGNQAFWSFEHNAIRKRSWAGYSYVARADGSKKRPFYAKSGGKVRQFNCAKYNMWDATDGRRWYTISKDTLWRVTLAEGLTDSVAEAVYRFPNAQGKVIQEISDGNFMLVEESGNRPNCYVLNLNRDPKDPHFCLTYPLKGGMGGVHSGSFRIMRSRKAIRGHYERGGQASAIRLSFESEKALRPIEKNIEDEIHITKGRRMAHLWYGPPDDRVGFFGSYNGRGGLWLQMPGKVPVLMAAVPDGHFTWCGRDPEWGFGAIGPGNCRDKQYDRRLVACNADCRTVKIVCTPFDRRRAGPKGYSSIPLPTQSRDGNKCWFHSSMLLPSNKVTGSYIAVFRRPHAPTKLRLKPGRRGVTLEWTPHPVNYEVKCYHVYRSSDGGRTFAEVGEVPVERKTFTDGSAGTRGGCVYAVTAEEWSRLESDTTSPTLKVRSGRAAGTGKGVTGWDRTTPKPVAGFRAARKDGLIRLTWKACDEKDLRYYNVYASSGGRPEVSQKRLLVSPPHDETFYIDWTAPGGAKINYAITAVDRQGNESGPAYAAAE